MDCVASKKWETADHLLWTLFQVRIQSDYSTELRAKEEAENIAQRIVETESDLQRSLPLLYFALFVLPNKGLFRKGDPVSPLFLKKDFSQRGELLTQLAHGAFTLVDSKVQLTVGKRLLAADSKALIEVLVAERLRENVSILPPAAALPALVPNEEQPSLPTSDVPPATVVAAPAPETETKKKRKKKKKSKPCAASQVGEPRSAEKNSDQSGPHLVKPSAAVLAAESTRKNARGKSKTAPVAQEDSDSDEEETEETKLEVDPVVRDWIREQIKVEVDRIKMAGSTALAVQVNNMVVVRMDDEVINRLEVESSMDFDKVQQIMISQPIECPVRPSFNFIMVLAFTNMQKPLPMIMPFLYQPKSSNDLSNWLFINAKGKESLHKIDAFSIVGGGADDESGSN